MCFPLACCGWMLLAKIFVFGQAKDTTVHTTTTLYHHKGDSANISCKFPLNDTEIFTVKLVKNNNELCSYMYQHRWMGQFCEDQFRFTWIPETNKTLFELSNLQINDAGTYSCYVKKLTPPPENIVWVESTIINVIVSPVLLMSCTKMHHGLFVILCSAEGFYPAAFEHQWRQDEKIINSSFMYSYENFSKNADGLFTQKFYLHLPSQTYNHTIFFCWLNHSSLSKPLMANISTTACHDQTGTFTVIVTSVISAMLFVSLIIVVACKCQRRQQGLSSVTLSVIPEPVFQTEQQTNVVYSSLGDHHPVPCSLSPNVNRSHLNTD